MRNDDRPTIICLTPVRNEAWILDLFLSCVSLWADNIIIADQGSEDASREIAAKYPKVILIDNKNRAFNESERQKMLIEAARKIPGKRLLVAFDADEIFTPEVLTSQEWIDVLNSSPGTVIEFNWANLRPGLREFWNAPCYIPFGFMDDGTEHRPLEIHSPRVPTPVGAPVIRLNNIKVMHYQYTHWERMRSKHRWYQCWERVNNSQRSPTSIFRQYHHMHAIEKSELCAVPQYWIDDYKKIGIDVTRLAYEDNFYWDKLILKYFEEYGTSYFTREAIWDIDWEEKARALGTSGPERFRDPRTLSDKLMHFWLWNTQRTYQKRLTMFVERCLTKACSWQTYA